MDLVAAIILLFLMGYILYDYYKRYQIEKYSSRYLELEHVTQRYLDSVREHYKLYV